MDIRDKVVIITGASAGIGLEAARLLAQHGAKLVLAARSTDKLEALAKELPDAIAITVNMRDQDAVKHMVEEAYKHYGRVDVLINNAGQGMYVPIEKINPKELQEIIDLNLIGPLVAMQEVIPKMREHGGGIILNISSGVSKMYIPNLGGYAATKYALNALSLTARAELAKDNIRVGVVYPRMTATDFGKNAKRDHQSMPIDMRAAPSNIPMDNVDLVAQKILEALQNEGPEQFMNEVDAERWKSAVQ